MKKLRLNLFVIKVITDGNKIIPLSKIKDAPGTDFGNAPIATIIKKIETIQLTNVLIVIFLSELVAIFILSMIF